jgi:hypothetical protein
VYDASAAETKNYQRGILLSMKTWQKRTTLILTSFALLLVFYVYGQPIAFLLFTKHEIRNSPELWTVPTPLSAAAAESPTGKTLSYYGYDFDAPWTEGKEEQNSKSLIRVNFSGGQTIAFFDPTASVNEVQLLTQQSAEKNRDARSIWGADAMRSRYAFRSTMLNLTPADLHLFASRQKMVADSVLLTLKGAYVSERKHGLYSFQTAWFRGFQYGAPAQDDGVKIEAFDAQDREVEMIVGCGHRISPRPSQADINRILFSLRPTPVPVAAPPAAGKPHNPSLPAASGQTV